MGLVLRLYQCALSRPVWPCERFYGITHITAWVRLGALKTAVWPTLGAVDILWITATENRNALPEPSTPISSF